MKTFLLRYTLHIVLFAAFLCFCMYYAKAQTTPATCQEVEVYPNPIENKLTVNGNGIYKIVITDILGNTVIVENTTESKNIIDTNKLKPGIYFILVKCSTGKDVVKRLVKQ